MLIDELRQSGYKLGGSSAAFMRLLSSAGA
jgi:hypothetical protein